MGDEKDEPIYTYNDEQMTWLGRQITKGGKCCALNQYYESVISNEVFKNTSKDVGVNGNVCEILNKCFDYTNNRKRALLKTRIWFKSWILQRYQSGRKKEKHMSRIKLVKQQYKKVLMMFLIFLTRF